jgi:thiol-disulfide isomerase/thioredoxin
MRVFYKLLLGILIIIISAGFILILFTEFIKIYNFQSLKWAPLLMAFLGFFIAGKINKKSKLIYNLPLLLGLFFFQLLKLLYFPHLFIIVLFSFNAILLSRDEVKNQLKLGIGTLSILLFGIYLFNQPLIIQNKGFGTDKYYNLYNASVLWDFSSNRPNSLPNINFEDPNGNKVNLSIYQGKTLYLTFWATWCGPSLEEKPDLEKLKAELKSNPNVVFIDISVDNDREGWASYISKNKPEGIQLISKNLAKTKAEFEFSGTPSHYIVDSEGNFKRYNSPKFVEKTLLTDSTVTNNYINTSYKVFQIIEDGEKEKLIRIK